MKSTSRRAATEPRESIRELGVSAATLPLEIGVDAPAPVREALAAIGRTEDVRFSPNGRRLALACYVSDRIAVVDVEITPSPSGPRIAATGLYQLASTALSEPHGLDFVDDDRLIVGNRSGGVVVFRLPSTGVTGEIRQIAPVDACQPRLLDAPASVTVRSLGSGRHELLACNNRANTITRHMLDDVGRPTDGEVVIGEWLDLPDGLAISDDGRWLAVSNHNRHSVLVFAFSDLDEHPDPVCVLRGVQYPHGLRFHGGDRHLLVADAGAPFVHVFVRPAAGWYGAAYPETSIRVMDDDTFARGRHNPQEGGPKGIDVDPRTNLLAVTSEYLPLAFFDLAAALDRPGIDDAEDARVRYELHVLKEAERVKAEVAEARARLTEIHATKAWRLMQPARDVYAALLRLRARRETRAR